MEYPTENLQYFMAASPPAAAAARRAGSPDRLLGLGANLGTDVRQAALAAEGPGPGRADIPSVIHQTMAEVAAFLRRPIRFTRRMQWVSVTIAGLPNTSPMIRLALFLPTPGRDSSASKSSGTRPSYRSTSIFMQALMSRALLRPSPQGFTISSISSTGAAASAWTVGNFSYSLGTTWFTLASVHWAARRTLTSSFHASS